VREREGIETLPIRKVLGKDLVKTLRTVLSQCRGRGFESLHLHQKAEVRGLKVDPPRLRPPKRDLS
jgi:hypothetical protein